MEVKSNKQRRISIIISFGLWVIAAVYILALVKIVLFKTGFCTELRSLNLIPFSFIKDFSGEGTTIDVFLKNILGNFALFIPLGVLVPTLFKKVSSKKTILICFGVSVFFEIIQYSFGVGAADVDDLMLNTFGGIIGTLLYFSFLKKIDDKAKVKIGTWGFLSAFGICSILALYLYQPNMLPMEIKYVNKEILKGLDTNSEDIEGACIGIEKDILIMDVGKRHFSDNYKNDDNKDGKYLINDNTKLFVQKKEFKYSPNGNIQKMSLTYVEITKEELQEIIKEEERHVSLWMADNKCSTVLVTQIIRSQKKQMNCRLAQAWSCA